MEYSQNKYTKKRFFLHCRNVCKVNRSIIQPFKNTNITTYSQCESRIIKYYPISSHLLPQNKRFILDFYRLLN